VLNYQKKEIYMEIIDAIFSRQSIANLRPDPVPRDLVERLLAAAVQAPNHYRVRPWRFVVLQGQARERLGDVFADVLLANHPGLPEAALDKERAKALRSPLLIAVGVDAPADPRVIETENICATAAAVENILLAAEALGLAAKWRTGDAAYDPRVKAFLGFEPEQRLISFLYIGYPNVEPAPVDRPSFEDRTTWME
jgi:nitroreductase